MKLVDVLVAVSVCAMLFLSGCVVMYASGTQASCSDSDGGKVLNVRGSVSGYQSNKWYAKTDYCSVGKVIEYYCSSNRALSYTGACSAGTECRDGACVTPCVPSAEVCDGVDNDCDGSVDEDVTRQCGSSVIGACTYGTEICNKGVWGACFGEVSPSAEVCDNVDNDCDSVTDEGLSQQCGVSNVGACRYGAAPCIAGVYTLCEGNVDPAPEACDGVDNDCDGVVDDGCSCVQGQSRPCGSDIGACSYGTQTCSAGTWGACLGGVGPSTEICDHLDNDCDGLTDEQACGNSSG